jgi:hypothetical protein
MRSPSMNWRDSYRATLTEVDPSRLLSLIRQTELAITLRSESLPKISNEEQEEMNDANCGLRILKSHTQHPIA